MSPMHPIIAAILIIAATVLAIIGTDWLAGSVGGDSRLWALVKFLIVAVAVFFLLQLAGIV